jgi:hypothetical protein
MQREVSSFVIIGLGFRNTIFPRLFPHSIQVPNDSLRPVFNVVSQDKHAEKSIVNCLL